MPNQLTRTAEAVLEQTNQVLSRPAALLLPADARQLIRELARVVFLLAVEVEACKVKTL